MSNFKQFENNIREALERVGGVTLRLPDQQSGFYGSANPCDFIHYNKPFFYEIECKVHEGNTFPFSCVTDTQWKEMLEASNVNGVLAGIFLWWTDKDETWWIPITVMKELKDRGFKSLNYSRMCDTALYLNIEGTKKRKYFDYNLTRFMSMRYVLSEVANNPKKYVDIYSELL